MTGIGYIILELVKLSVCAAFRFSPINAKDMFIYTEVSKLFIVLLTVFIMSQSLLVTHSKPVISTSQQSQVTNVQQH
jgi:hypothetical protein